MAIALQWTQKISRIETFFAYKFQFSHTLSRSFSFFLELPSSKIPVPIFQHPRNSHFVPVLLRKETSEKNIRVEISVL